MYLGLWFKCVKFGSVCMSKEIALSGSDWVAFSWNFFSWVCVRLRVDSEYNFQVRSRLTADRNYFAVFASGDDWMKLYFRFCLWLWVGFKWNFRVWVRFICTEIVFSSCDGVTVGMNSIVWLVVGCESMEIILSCSDTNTIRRIFFSVLVRIADWLRM